MLCSQVFYTLVLSSPVSKAKDGDAVTIYMLLSGPSHVRRSYCNTDLHPEHRHLSQLEAIKLYLKGKEPLLQCECASKRGVCLWWWWGVNAKPSVASVFQGNFALAETISHIKSSQMSASCRNKRRNVGYGKSCRIPNPRLTLYTRFIPIPNHLVK